MISALAVLIAAYLLGAIPFGYLLVKWKTGADVRSSGSGNIGATNVLRTTGRAMGVATLALDIAKGYFAVWLAGKWTDGNPTWMAAAALAVMAGHGYPIFLNFQGGKCVATKKIGETCTLPVECGGLACERQQQHAKTGICTDPCGPGGHLQQTPPK